MSYIYADSVAHMERFCEEQKVLLGAEGEAPVWLGYYDENGVWHNVCFVVGVDGTCWTAHPLSAEKVLEANTYDNPAVQVLDELPEGWKAKVEDADG